jgi:hypothetical protein
LFRCDVAPQLSAIANRANRAVLFFACKKLRIAIRVASKSSLIQRLRKSRTFIFKFAPRFFRAEKGALFIEMNEIRSSR